jgi:hypothetical protein
MHLNVSDVIAIASYIATLFVIALVEAMYPLWCEAQVFGKHVSRDERQKRVSKAFERHRN